MNFKNKSLLVIIMLLYFALRFPGLGYDISNSDSARWHRRSERFINAVRQGRFIETYQHYQPGITISWLDGIVNKAGFYYQTRIKGDSTPMTLENSEYYPAIHGISKTVIVSLLGILLIYQTVLVRRIFSEKAALLFALFMAVEPFLIGVDRWFHLTSMEAYFAFSSLLSIIYWYRSKDNAKKFLVLSAVFFALSVASKLTTLLTVPVYLYIFVLKFRTKKTSDVLLFAGIAAGFFIALFPALWVDPVFVYDKLYSAAFNAVTDNIRAELISPVLLPVYYLVILGLKLSPITLLIFIFTFLYYKKIAVYKEAHIIFLNLAFYFTALTIAEQKIDRYTIAMFPSILLLCALLISKLRLKVRLLTVLTSIVFAAIVVYVYHPVYSAYYSPLFGGTNSALAIDLYDNSGEYYSQAARFLNTKDRNSNTYLPYNLEAFSYYYNGNIQREFSADTDFVVTSVNHLDELDELSGCRNFVHSFGSKEIPIVYIYSCYNSNYE